MADLTINIPQPILTTGQYFKVRYRALPSGAWSGYTNRTNAPFTITGLSAGDYEFKFILVNADATECPATYRTYTIEEDYTCISFNSEMKEVNGLYHIEITYTIPGGHTDPSCGWEVVWIQNGKMNTVPFSNLPGSGIIKIPCQNLSAVLYIKAKMCSGKVKDCHSADVSAIPDPPCINMSNIQMIITHKQVGNSCEYYLEITFSQSAPATTQPHLFYEQWRQSGLGVPHDKFSGVITIAPTATKIVRKINPHFFEGEECTEYRVNFTDVCGGVSSQRINFCREYCFDETP